MLVVSRKAPGAFHVVPSKHGCRIIRACLLHNTKYIVRLAQHYLRELVKRYFQFVRLSNTQRPAPLCILVAGAAYNESLGTGNKIFLLGSGGETCREKR